MGEQSGEDPQAAVQARHQIEVDEYLRALMVDGGRGATEWFVPNPRLEIVIDQPLVFIPLDEIIREDDRAHQPTWRVVPAIDQMDEIEASLSRLTEEFDPDYSVRFYGDPGDESDAA